ncbi:DNA polymerase III subunit alpha [Comamonas aquatica]|uniref:DNA polymerase III subunit alpha n=1 Tax=Comamonas aquatica TaxID=225991 RepID=A0AA42W5D8_9BURK|nr:DNA polymerase III subunit alpha [Comamonas aquatica]MDH1428597.1 DNA polymerase III subunit alpha [Comamonas aquatica]MDH1606435.1 DNA polymerase III subunit alpha [Comamonas aquatica]MDH1618211.1 DNA polymerase III subunit alpha [Comamonas aquatica]MDH2006241.1 DNA polymerase III subunit alpha [Comamonas aquatica]
MFVHLRLHTEFSVVDGTCRINDVINAAAADSQPALAITDLNNLFGALKFYKAGRGKGVKPILGAELNMEGLAGGPTSRVLVLVQSQHGYHNLSEILARGWTGNVSKVQAQPFFKWEWLQELGEGLLLLSGANAGPIGQALLRGDIQGAADMALQLASMFPHRFYLELQRAGRSEDEKLVMQTVQLAARLHLPVVATHPIQFYKPADYESHETRVCISEGEVLGNPKRVRRFTREQYFKSSADMEQLFADIPSAIENTVEIARRCSVSLLLGKYFLPDFPTPNGMSIADYFRRASFEGLEERLMLLFRDAAARNAKRPQYVERLEFELGIILKMGFPGYFLIVADFINWAKNNGCPVGPGRGSGAGSLVAYVLQITDLDPIHYNLLFERFLNPERVSMPDFDVDFCQANRDRVIDYVKDRYGRNAVSQIATFGTMAARAVIRDVGRAMDMSYTFCDGISKLIPNKPGLHVTLKYPPNPKKEGDKYTYAIEAEPVLAQRIEQEEDVKNLIELAQKLEGMTRNIGMHAGGVVIAPGKLTDFCPLYQQPGSDSAVAMFDKDDVEQIGLVKFDFLGLATLTILEIAREFIMKRHKGQENFRFEEIPLDDYPTYKLFQEGKTEAVFQFESRGMQGMLRDAKPSRLEDLIALNALYRPGPMDLIPSFVARKHGREQIEYPHPLVEQVLAETYGIMVYQEQVMQTAQVLGGYSLGGADLLRRAMGKKKVEEMVKHRATFCEGAAKQGIDEHKAGEVFDLMEKFAGYGFNKSHAAAYSLLAYHTAWLKVHYTAEFFCGNMTVEMDNTDKLKVLYEDALKMGMSFEMPDVNRGVYRFEPVTDQVIRYGLGAIKGTGQQAIEAIIAAREGQGVGPDGHVKGPFKSLCDFCARVDRSKLNKRTLEALIKAGAFDSIHLDRAALVASIDHAFEYANAQLANANQGGLFDMMGDDAQGSSTQEPALAEVLPWGVKERLTQEKLAVGFYLSGHLFDEVEHEVRNFLRTPLSELGDSREPQLLAGIVSDLRVINGQRGKLCLFKLDDKSAVLEASVDEATLNAHSDLLKDDEFVVLSGRVQHDHFSGGLRIKAQNVFSLADARCRFARYLQVDAAHKLPDVQRLLREFPAQREVTPEGELRRGLRVRLGVRCEADGMAALAEVDLGEQHKFYPSDAALAAWRAEVGTASCQLVWRNA